MDFKNGGIKKTFNIMSHLEIWY